MLHPLRLRLRACCRRCEDSVGRRSWLAWWACWGVLVGRVVCRLPDLVCRVVMVRVAAGSGPLANSWSSGVVVIHWQLWGAPAVVGDRAAVPESTGQGGCGAGGDGSGVVSWCCWPAPVVDSGNDDATIHGWRSAENFSFVSGSFRGENRPLPRLICPGSGFVLFAEQTVPTG